MSLKGLHFFVLFTISIIASQSLVLCSAQVREQEVTSAIFQAEDSIRVAYLLVIDAERVDAQTSQLVEELNGAIDILCEAKRAVKKGNFEMASSLTKNATYIADSVGDDTRSLKKIAEYEGEIELRNRSIFTFVSVYFIILFGFLGWNQFKAYYIRRMMGMKPGVSNDEY